MSHPVCSSKLFESWLSGESKKHNKTPAFRTLWKTPESGHYAGRSFFSERWSIPSPIRAPIACSGRLLALIQQKTALLFWKSFISLPISQSGVELQLKITANSTYWEANLSSDDLEARDREKWRFSGIFWKIPNPDIVPADPFSWKDDLFRARYGLRLPVSDQVPGSKEKWCPCSW